MSTVFKVNSNIKHQQELLNTSYKKFACDFHHIKKIYELSITKLRKFITIIYILKVITKTIKTPISY